MKYFFKCIELKHILKSFVFLAILTVSVFGIISATIIIPDSIAENVKSQMNTIAEDIMKNIEVTKSDSTVHLKSIVHTIDTKNDTIEKTIYSWNDEHRNWDGEKVYFDSTKNYESGNDYKCCIYKFSYEISEARRIISEYICIVDENGKNSDGESFDLAKCCIVSLGKLANVTVELKTDIEQEKALPITFLIFVCSVCGVIFSLLALFFVFDDIKTDAIAMRNRKENYSVKGYRWKQ